MNLITFKAGQMPFMRADHVSRNCTNTMAERNEILALFGYSEETLTGESKYILFL